MLNAAIKKMHIKRKKNKIFNRITLFIMKLLGFGTGGHAAEWVVCLELADMY